MDESDAQRQPYWPELEELARPAREHRRLAPERRGEIIINLCRRAPLSVKDLSVLLDRSEAYIGDAIRPLVYAGQLTFLYPDQPRHPRQKYMSAPEVSVDLDSDEISLEVPETYLTPPTRQEIREELAHRVAPAAPRAARAAAAVPEEEGGRIPNPLVNLVYAVAAGVALGWTNPLVWWVIAIAAAFALSIWHKAANTRQYRQFGTLDAFPTDGSFLLLKSAVTFVEIVLVFFATRAILGR